MATKEERYAEAYRRNILSPELKSRYEEAVRRGLMKNPELLAKLKGESLPDIDLPPENTDSAATQALKESARAMVTGAASLADIIPEVGDSFVSAVAWVAGKLGVGDGTYTPAARFKNMEPDTFKPQTEGGRLMAEMIPYMVSPEAKTAELPALAKKLTTLGERLARSGSQNIAGSLAQSDASGDDFAGTLAGNVFMGELFHGGGKLLGAGYKALTGAPAEAEREIIQAAISQDVHPASLKPVEDILSDVGKSAKKGAPGPGDELAYAVNPSQDILSAAERLGMHNVLLPSHYSTNPAYQAIEQGLKSIPGSVLDAHEKKAIELLANKTDELINEFGGTIDKTELSDRFKKNSLDVIRALEEKSNDLFNKVEKQIPRDKLVGTKAITKHLQEKADIFGGMEFLSPAEQGVMRQMDPESMPTYARLNAVRQQIGDALSKKQGPFKDVSTGELKQLYGKLADDQQQAANYYGVGNEYTLANDLVSQRKTLEKDLINLLGKDLSGALTTAAGRGMKALSKGDYKTFDQVMARLPSADAREEVVLTALNDAFTIGARNEKQLNMPGFVAWYKGLMRNPGALARVEKNIPADAAKRLRDIFEVANGISSAKKKEITTGRITALLDRFDKDNGVLAKLFGTGAKTAAAGVAGGVGGAPAAAVASTAIALLSRPKEARSVMADRLLASNDFKSMTRQVAAGKAETGEQRDRLQKLLQRTDVYKKWHNTLSGKEQQTIARIGLINWLTGTDDN